MEENLQNPSKIKEFSEKFNELMKEYNVTPEIHLDFPEYKNLPIEVQLALMVMNKHKNQFVLNFKENNNEN
jgi:hypothetical protein